MKGVAEGVAEEWTIEPARRDGDMAMYAVEADRWECEAWPRYIVAEPLLKLLSVLLLSGSVGPRKYHFREIGRGPARRRKYISRTLMASSWPPASVPSAAIRPATVAGVTHYDRQ